MKKDISRRRFLGTSANLGIGLTILPAGLARAYAANEKLGVGVVGVSGRGSWFVETIPRIGENVVALCDVNLKRAAEAFQKLPNVPKYQDFRKMLAERDKQIDAVFVATRFGRTLEFEPLACKIVNHADADAALSRPYRKGWSL